MMATKKSEAKPAPVTMKWACPKCGAEANGHGKGGAEKCREHGSGGCSGFICECENESDEKHGAMLKTPCPEAHCYHCGWGGTFPTKAHLKKQNLIPCPHCKGSGTVKDMTP